MCVESWIGGFAHFAVCAFGSFPDSHSHCLQSVSARLVSTLSLPLCLYPLWFSGPARLADKIKSMFRLPSVSSVSHSLFVFLSTTLQGKGMCVRGCVYLCARPYHIIGLDIKASYLQRVSQGFSGNLERTWYRCISQIISPLGYAGLKGKQSCGHESYA